MTHRQDLLTLITNGTSTADIYYFFINQRKLSRPSVIVFLHDEGVHFRLPETDDNISDERRMELQLLSMTE